MIAYKVLGEWPDETIRLLKIYKEGDIVSCWPTGDDIPTEPRTNFVLRDGYAVLLPTAVKTSNAWDYAGDIIRAKTEQVVPQTSNEPIFELTPDSLAKIARDWGIVGKPSTDKAATAEELIGAELSQYMPPGNTNNSDRERAAVLLNLQYQREIRDALQAIAIPLSRRSAGYPGDPFLHNSERSDPPNEELAS